MIGPRFAAMADEFLLVDFVKVDVDANQEVSQQCGVPRAWTPVHEAFSSHKAFSSNPNP